MITDQIKLGNAQSYVRQDNGSLNLATGGLVTARTPRLNDKQFWDVSKLDLLIKGNNLMQQMEFPSDSSIPLLQVQLQKEVFPDLFFDPFSSRVFSLAGMQDFESGSFKNCMTSRVNGIATIVSNGIGPCVWASKIYFFPKDVKFHSSFWELASSKLIQEDHFTYKITLKIWNDHNVDRQADQEIVIANNKDADDNRIHEFSNNEQMQACHAFQIQFEADVQQDSSFYEVHRVSHREEISAENMTNTNIGTPLLRAIRLIEKVDSSYAFYSLSELIHASEFYQFLPPQSSNPDQLLLSMELSALLVGKASSEASYEYIMLSVQGDEFDIIEAKLDIDESYRLI